MNTTICVSGGLCHETPVPSFLSSAWNEVKVSSPGTRILLVLVYILAGVPVFLIVLKAIFDAQGKGCSPGVIGVAIGGDRMTGYQLAKQQLFRKIGERSADAELAQLETALLSEANSLGIGPMGLGGNSTVLDVFIASQHRHPATFYVTVAYMCWACRRRAMTFSHGEVTHD